MSGFEVYNSAGALTIDSNNRSTVSSQLKYIDRPLIDYGYYTAVKSAFGTGAQLGFLPYQFFETNNPTLSVWCQMTIDGEYAFPGAGMFHATNSARFMITRNDTALSSGYLDCFDGSGRLVWSASAAGTMPRIVGFFTIPAGYNLANTITINTPANPWFLYSAMPFNVSDGEGALGYSGIAVKRVNATTWQLQYPNQYQRSYLDAVGNRELRIPLAYFTGY
ncbi:hypothetical protein ACYCNZ_09865 [Escherichia coli]